MKCEDDFFIKVGGGRVLLKKEEDSGVEVNLRNKNEKSVESDSDAEVEGATNNDCGT